MKPGLGRVWLFYFNKFIAKTATSSKLKKLKKKRKKEQGKKGKIKETKVAFVKQ